MKVYDLRKAIPWGKNDTYLEGAINYKIVAEGDIDHDHSVTISRGGKMYIELDTGYHVEFSKSDFSAIAGAVKEASLEDS